MSNTKFTPGPWFMQGRYVTTKFGEQGYTESIAKVDEFADPYKEEEEANKALIAAAPELYEAMEPFAALLKPHMKKIGDEIPVFQIDDAIITAGDLRRANAALAKARGEKTDEK